MAMRMVSACAEKVNEASTRPANAARSNVCKDMGESPRIIYWIFVSATIRAWWETRGVWNLASGGCRMASWAFGLASSRARSLPQLIVGERGICGGQSINCGCGVARESWGSVDIYGGYTGAFASKPAPTLEL